MRRALVGSLGTRLGLLGGNLWVDLAQDLGVDGLGCLRGVRRTLNNQLRTGTDKGNLTV